jgi:hypothetical protein
MRTPKIRIVVGALIVFILGFICYPALVHLLQRLPGPKVDRKELMRSTSPDGRFDAVLVADYWGGAVGGIDWFVYIVGKGSSTPDDPNKAVFLGESMRGERIRWKQAHLVEIGYDRAQIVRFRNMWALNEIENVGAYGQDDYCVELRLAPTSQDFSLLQPNGDFMK